LQRSAKGDERAVESWKILAMTFDRDNGTKFGWEKVRQHAKDKKSVAKAKLLEHLG
jgi:hypothetical protein